MPKKKVLKKEVKQDLPKVALDEVASSVYELVLVLPEELEVKKGRDLIQKLIDEAEGKTIEVKEMGKRRFSYPIKKHASGNYFLFRVELPTLKVAELRENFRQQEDVLRALVVKVGK